MALCELCLHKTDVYLFDSMSCHLSTSTESKLKDFRKHIYSSGNVYHLGFWPIQRISCTAVRFVRNVVWKYFLIQEKWHH